MAHVAVPDGRRSRSAIRGLKPKNRGFASIGRGTQSAERGVQFLNNGLWITGHAPRPAGVCDFCPGYALLWITLWILDNEPRPARFVRELPKHTRTQSPSERRHRPADLAPSRHQNAVTGRWISELMSVRITAKKSNHGERCADRGTFETGDGTRTTVYLTVRNAGRKKTRTMAGFRLA